MPGPTIYTRNEVAQLREAAREGGTPICPRCDTEMAPRKIPPNRDVSYVRRRTWWVCPGCGRSLVVDDSR